MSKLKLIVGLGNPGPSYMHTRHNAGQMWLEQIAERYQAPLKSEGKFFGQIANTTIEGHSIRLLIPSTYMNRSGQAVGAICQFYKIEPEEILVAHDELDFAPGIAKLKTGGGHGGHNGLRDIIQSLGNQKGFHRLRIGIGHPGSARQVSDYVLKKAAPQEFEAMQASLDASLKQLPLMLAGKWPEAMKNLHTQNN